MSLVTRDQLSDFAARSERNYLSRMKFAQRMQNRGRLWNAALISLSTASALVSVAMLKDATIYGPNGAYLWCAIGVLTLIASLVIANAGYGEKAALLFEAYRQFQRISVDADFASRTLRLRGSRQRTFERLNSEYQLLLDRTPNHSPVDFARAMTWRLDREDAAKPERPSYRYVSLVELAKWRALIALDIGINCIPIVLAMGSAALLVPTLAWMIGG
ncbi:SLATT domain-containing protein [uncultured Leifsonia sp.]|nr:SLATT domain-containing protein [uncultured Leifsonia sp.]